MSDWRHENRETRTRAGERGSALLIVFVFAAIVAIMLYKELPVSVFEAQRQKEELLIDRGNEYAHAVKLFVRKIGTYPASIDALEKTNQMRFLRHRFKDPFTGKDEWRLLHAGPNGVLIDSKVNPLGNGPNGTGPNANGTQNGLTSTNAFGSTSNTSSSFGSNGGFGSSSSNTDSTPAEVVVAPVTQRPPAIAANGSAQAAASQENQNPLAPLLPPGQAQANASGQPTNAPGGTNTGQPAMAGQMDTSGGAPGQNAAQAGGNTAATGIGTPQQGSTNRTGALGTTSGMGTITTGGIAGVASKAGGHSIKTVNDQTDYSLWEFYYDPQKDAARGITNALGSTGATQQANQQQNGLGNTSGPGNSNSIFGNSNSAFGSNSSSGTSSPFGSSSGNSSSNTPTAPGATSPGVTPQQQ